MNKELTLKDIVIIAIVLGGIVASFIPTINNHPSTEFFLGIASILFIIIFAVLYISISLMDKGKNGIPVLIVGVIAILPVAFFSYKLTEPNLTSGQVLGKYWETKIVIIKPETDTSDERITQTPSLSGNYKEPVKWKEYVLAPDEEVKSKTLTYSIMVWANGTQTEYICSFSDWNKVEINDPIEFTFSQYNKTIDRIY